MYDEKQANEQIDRLARLAAYSELSARAFGLAVNVELADAGTVCRRVRVVFPVEGKVVVLFPDNTVEYARRKVLEIAAPKNPFAAQALRQTNEDGTEVA